MSGSIPLTHSEKLELLATYKAKPETALLSEREVSTVLGCSLRKLQRDRMQGLSIPYLKVGRNVRYRKVTIEKYLNSGAELTCTREARGI